MLYFSFLTSLTVRTSTVVLGVRGGAAVVGAAVVALAVAVVFGAIVALVCAVAVFTATAATNRIVTITLVSIPTVGRAIFS